MTDSRTELSYLSYSCLSAITLAGRCMDQAFRMHLRAHGTVTEFCRELHDSPSHPVLSLLAATVLFVLSQDRLNMDLDTESLKLILALTKSDFGPDGGDDGGENVENAKNRQRVIQLCSEMKARGHAKHLNLEKITVNYYQNVNTILTLVLKRHKRARIYTENAAVIRKCRFCEEITFYRRQNDLFTVKQIRILTTIKS